MRFKSILALGALIASTLGLTSCSNDDFKQDASQPKGHPVKVTVNASIGQDADSRAIMEETASYGIKSRWDKGDMIFAYNVDKGYYAGFLTADEADEEGYATFSGTLYLDGNCDLTFYYLGTDPNRDFNEFWIDLENQSYDLNALGEMAIMWDSDIHFKYTSETTGQLNRDLSFTLMLSYVHFNIILPEGVEYNGEPITVTGQNLKSGAALLLLKNELYIEDWEEGESITITGIGDRYVALIPANDVALHFQLFIDEREYVYDYPRLMNFESGIYYRRQLADGTCVGVPITFQPAHPDFTFTLAFDNGHEPEAIAMDMTDVENLPENITATVPLDSYTFTIPDQIPTREGYEFLGYQDYGQEDNVVNEAYAPGSEIEVVIDDPTVDRDGDNFEKKIQCVWKEIIQHEKNTLLKWAESDLKRSGSGANATGEFTGSYTTTGYYFQFGRNHGYQNVTDAENAYAVENSDIPAGRNVYTGYYSTQTVPQYSAAKSIANYPQYFFIDTNHNGDYASPDHNQTWTERAEQNGYSKPNPCPDGWRLPTVEEYRAILPLIDGKNASLGNNAWNTLVQFKDAEDGAVHMAFRWSKEVINNYNYLRIDCVVLSRTVTDASKVDWNSDKVVTRYFKGAGYLQAHRNLWKLTSYGVTTTHYTARPMEWGVYTSDIAQVSPGYAVVVLSETESYMKYGGFYWTSDADQGLFTMVFNQLEGYNYGYYLAKYKNPIAANIRCVRAD